MIRLLRALDRFWFAPAPASRLALLRILLGGYTFFYLWRRRRMILDIARSDPTLFKPVGVVAGLTEPLPLPAVRSILFATLAANIAFVLGWRHRYNGPLFAGLLLWLLCYRNSWSMIYHNDNVLVLHALVLAVAPAADAYALDAQGMPATQAPSYRYGWPIQLMNSVTTLTYFLAGVAKLAGPLGHQWTSGEALRSQILVDGLRKEVFGDSASPLASRLYDRVALFQLMAWGSLVAELAAPAMLANRRLAQLWAGNAYLMHWGIYFLMKIKFRYQLSGLIFAPFFPVERLLDLVRRR